MLRPDELLEQLDDLRMNRRLTAAQHEHVDATVLTRQSLIDVRQHGLHRHHARQARRRLGEARRAAQVALRDDVLEQNAGVLRLELAESAEIRARNGIEVRGGVRRVRLRGRGPLLEIAKDLRDSRRTSSRSLP